MESFNVTIQVLGGSQLLVASLTNEGERGGRQIAVFHRRRYVFTPESWPCSGGSGRGGPRQGSGGVGDGGSGVYRARGVDGGRDEGTLARSSALAVSLSWLLTALDHMVKSS